MIQSHAPYSYLSDTAIPDVGAGQVFTVMDAHCALCARGARWIARNDRRFEFRIIPMQSPAGAALMRHYDLDPADPSSWLYVEDGHAYSSLDAVIRAGARMGGIWHGLAVLRLIPPRFQDRLYAWVARNRYRLSGRADLCAMPDPDVKKRLIR